MLGIGGLMILVAGAASGDIIGWLNWRGPHQSGVSDEKNLPDTWSPGGKNDLWHLDISGGGTPVIANGKLFALTYSGTGGYVGIVGQGYSPADDWPKIELASLSRSINFGSA